MVAATSMTTTTATTEEPILSRLDRLDIMLRQLEEIKGCNHVHRSSHSAKSSCESTPSSETLTSEYAQVSSTTSSLTADHFSPKSQLDKHCRPIQNVMMETGAKGTLIERLDHVEERVLKLCMQLEDEFEAAERKREDRERAEVVEEVMFVDEKKNRQKKKKKGFKQLVKRCVTGKTD